MNKKLFLITLLLIASCTTTQEINKEQMGEMGEHTHEEGELHFHNLHEVQNNPPTITATANKDPHGGYNLHLITTNFIFAPHNVNEQHIQGQGHAHLYIDGKKISRIYNEYHHLTGYDEGTHEIIITLTTNDHQTYSHNNKTIQANITIPTT